MELRVERRDKEISGYYPIRKMKRERERESLRGTRGNLT
jgi:hypothetical protein